MCLTFLLWPVQRKYSFQDLFLVNYFDFSKHLICRSLIKIELSGKSYIACIPLVISTWSRKPSRNGSENILKIWLHRSNYVLVFIPYYLPLYLSLVFNINSLFSAIEWLLAFIFLLNIHILFEVKGFCGTWHNQIYWFLPAKRNLN